IRSRASRTSGLSRCWIRCGATADLLQLELQQPTIDLPGVGGAQRSGVLGTRALLVAFRDERIAPDLPESGGESARLPHIQELQGLVMLALLDQQPRRAQ